MLLVHQAGSVKIGEVVRYTLTYTPSNDRILPTPSHLHLKVKNTSAIPLRAAWIHGPYALHVSAYPSTFNPHHKVEQPKRYGVPEYEPMLKAAGSWQSKLLIPEEIRETGADLGKKRLSTHGTKNPLADEDGNSSVTWIIEIASQILFSTSASVDFEILVGRDERSLELGFAAVAGYGHGGPGQIKDLDKHRQKAHGSRPHHNHQTAGVYSKAVRLVVENTEALWDKPALPTWEDLEKTAHSKTNEQEADDDHSKPKKSRKRKKIHLVIVTHGLHSNVGADMLFMKESIDATVKQARTDAKKRKAEYRAKEWERKQKEESVPQQDGEGGFKSPTEDDGPATAPLTGGQEDLDSEDDEEETIVRGFSGNQARTENGIQYLGKRLAKYILKLTYPDQPFLPIKKPLSRTFTDGFKSQAEKARRDGLPAHSGSSVHMSAKQQQKAEDLPYTFSSISFIGHSLGGLIQTYAVAYIHKHSPTFFKQIEPVNFICMASPMLGLSNENPMYVKFALDFGLVGRTGQDLGLTWRPPTLASARGGWNAMIGGLGGGQQKDQEQEDPSAKPLLRILPTGPAHQVLRMFRNRTLYSNVVNDGIVPLRTSCLLFLDWRGLGKVDKARRENGLIGTAAEWAWAELTGANSSSVPPNVRAEQYNSIESESDSEQVRRGEGETVPQPAEDETTIDNRKLTGRVSLSDSTTSAGQTETGQSKSPQQQKGMLDSFMDYFRSPPPTTKRPEPVSKKTSKAIKRAQTVRPGEDALADDEAQGMEGTTSNPTMRPHLHGATAQGKRPAATKGDSFINNPSVNAPPKTSIFESAGDILHPPLPSKQWITDPGSRSRTIFHDRVYHPDDIPPPPVKRPGSRLGRTFSSDSTKQPSRSSKESTHSVESVDTSMMKVEEKIARAYHRDLSWRKVLVRLEPDAHNNMIVRRMFANAYGWPVVKHLCDTHFADTYSARTRDEAEPAKERAPAMSKPVNPDGGEEVANQTTKRAPTRTDSEMREARDELSALSVSQNSSINSSKPQLARVGSAVWDDAIFDGPDDDESDVDERGIVQRWINPMAIKKPEQSYQPKDSSRSSAAPRSPTTAVPYTDGHRGLAPSSPQSPKSARSGSLKHPESTRNVFDAGDIEQPVVTNKLVSEPEPMEGGSTAELGLRHSEDADTARRESGGHIAEEVARKSSIGGGHEGGG